MGCGGSQLNAEGEAIPAKLRPNLRRRIEEIRRRRRSGRGKDTTPCGKELLLNNYETENSMASCVTSEDSKGSAATQPEVGDPQTEESAKGKINKLTAAKGNVKDGSENDVDKEDIISHDNEEDYDDDEGMDGNDDRLIFPGSPSFRIYFTDNLEDDDVDKDYFNDGGKKEMGATEKASRDHGMPPEEDSKPKKPKKGKRRSFRKVIPKGGQSAMKNLFNVRSCYTPSCSSHDRAHLLTEKTPA